MFNYAFIAKNSRFIINLAVYLSKLSSDPHNMNKLRLCSLFCKI